MDYSLFKNGLHDLKNQLLELQLVWDLIAEENKIENNRFGKMLGKVKITAEFLQEITRCNDAVEPIDLGNIINTAILELKEKGLLFPCLITDSLPIVTVNRSLLLWMLQALFPIALRRFKRGILVKGEVNKEVVLLFFEAGSEPLPEKLYIPWDLGTSTVNCLLSLLNGKVEWNDETSNNSIKITLPSASEVCVTDRTDKIGRS